MNRDYRKLSYTELEEILYEYKMLCIDAKNHGFTRAAKIYELEMKKLTTAMSKFGGNEVRGNFREGSD